MLNKLKNYVMKKMLFKWNEAEQNKKKRQNKFVRLDNKINVSTIKHSKLRVWYPYITNKQQINTTRKSSNKN